MTEHGDQVDLDTMHGVQPWLVRSGLRVGGMACFAAVYPVVEVWPRYFTGTATPPTPAIALGLAFTGIACFRQANRSILEVQPPASELPSPDLE
ncbi:MAG: hypothetical protein JWO41_673 [Candidatus Saccharibacteria bacterium]|nr:hypothetical protein [Candidatus Saccharibacteria bacterium]